MLDRTLLLSQSDLSKQKALLKQLNALVKTIAADEINSIAELSSEQLLQLDSDTLDEVLLIQRFLFLIQPIPALASFTTTAPTPQTRQMRRCFAADASMFHMLLDIEELSGLIDPCFLWLKAACATNPLIYQHSMIELTLAAQTPPDLLYYWLTWGSFIQDDDDLFTDGFLYLLSQLKLDDVPAKAALSKLILYAAQTNLLPKLISIAVVDPRDLTSAQLIFLCDRSLEVAPDDKLLRSAIMQLGPWSWWENYMKRQVQRNFELLKSAMTAQEYLDSISRDKETQFEFLMVLDEQRITYRHTLELLETVEHHKARSLLIVYLLSQEDYLTRLEGQPFQKQFDPHLDRAYYQPSRLNALIQQLDLSTLTENTLHHFTPEAAVSVLCSVQHFHLFTQDQVKTLVNLCPNLEQFLEYWTKHYLPMPNSYVLLAHFFNVLGPTAEQKFAAEAARNYAPVRMIIEHLELFTQIPSVLLERENAEANLQLAINVFLRKPNYEVYVAYITELITMMFDQKSSKNNRHFAIPSMQSLLLLNGHPQFAEVMKRASASINPRLAAHARTGNLEFFYRENQLEHQAMTQTIPYMDSETHPFINTLKNHKKTVSAFDYYLIHYTANTDELKRLLNDFLTYTAAQALIDYRSLHHLVLLLKEAIDPAVKTAIFRSVLAYPQLFDGLISSCLLRFDAKSALHHFGMQGTIKGYQQTITLCALALPLMDNNPVVKDAIIKARTEAQFELDLPPTNGYFSSVYIFVQRCWMSGWAGFFFPNTPSYVLAKENTQHVVPISTPVSTYKKSKSLDEVLDEIDALSNIKEFDPLIKAMHSYSPINDPMNEWDTRYSIHQLFQQLNQRSLHDAMLELWLREKRWVFITNYKHLFELSFIHKPLAETRALVALACQHLDYFHPLQKELNQSLPQFLQPSAPVQSLEENQKFITVSKVGKQIAGGIYGFISKWSSSGSSQGTPSSPPTEASNLTI